MANGELGLCVDCGKQQTSLRDNGVPVCGHCSNARFFRALREGKMVVLNIDMTKVKQSTLMKIEELIQADHEAHKG